MKLNKISDLFPGSPRLWLMLGFVFAAVFGFLSITDEVFENGGMGDDDILAFDRAALKLIAGWRSDDLTQTMIDLTALGSVSVVIVLSAVVGAWLLFSKDKTGGFHLLLALAGAGFWPYILKLLFGRARPDVAEHLVRVGDLSFPSGHAFGSSVVYTTFALLLARHFKVLWHELFFFGLAFMIIFLIGISRIYLGVHYPTDVVAGIAAGSAWSFSLSFLFSLKYRREKRIVVD